MNTVPTEGRSVGGVPRLLSSGIKGLVFFLEKSAILSLTESSCSFVAIVNKGCV